MEDSISIIIGEGGRDSLSMLISSLRVGGSNEGRGGIPEARGRNMARSRGVVVIVFSFHMRFTFIPYTLGPLLGSMSCRHKKSFHPISGRMGRGERWGSFLS